MTTDERFERLIERHEALAQTVEHLAAQGEEQNKRIDKLLAVVDAIASTVSDLALIARDHERRIGKVDGGNGSESGR